MHKLRPVVAWLGPLPKMKHRNPVRCGREVVLIVRVDRIEGRKVFLKGQMR